MRHFARVLFVRPGMEFLAIEQRVGDHSLWNLPGGKIDPDERPRQAALREVLEEVDIKVNVARVRKITRRVVQINTQSWVGHFFVAFGSFSLPLIMEPDKILRAEWVSRERAAAKAAHHTVFTGIFDIARDKFGVGTDWGSGLECLRLPTSSLKPDKETSHPLLSLQGSPSTQSKLEH